MDAVNIEKGSNKPLDQHFDVQSAKTLNPKKSEKVVVEVESCMWPKLGEIKSSLYQFS